MDDRYLRHYLIPDWNQQKLADASVVIVGMGALGNEVSRILAMSGVGHLIICDPDRIEESNLSRTIFFRQEDVGKLKVDVAAAALVSLAPSITVEQRSQPFVHGLGLAELRDASLVVSCLDSHSARLKLAGRCQLVKAVCIDGGTHPWGGEVRPFLDYDGPCYGCSLTSESRSVIDEPWSCLDDQPEIHTGAAIPSSALVGTWMGMIAVRFLMSINIFPGLLSIDGTRGTTKIIQHARDPECPLHMPLDKVSKVDLSAQDTILNLRALIGEDTVALAWDPVQHSVECPQCDFSEARWGLPGEFFCPKCQSLLRPRTTLELDKAPDELKLSDVGIPPREIISIRTLDGLKWIELQ
jgi:molybdopterin-synthase adenylyltransferase